MNDGAHSNGEQQEGSLTEEACFTVFCQEVGPEAFRLSIHWIRNRQLAEDILQEAFIRTWKSWHTVKSNRRGWFFQILWRVFLDKRKMMSGDVPLSDDIHALQYEQSYRDVEDRSEIDWLLRSLSESDRHLLALHYGSDFTLRQIAEITEMRVGTVKSRIHRALNLVRSKLPQKFNPEGGTKEWTR